MSDFLTRMAAGSRERVRAARLAEPETSLLARARDERPPPPLRLGTFDVIAELKLRSPAAGGLAADGLDLGTQVEAYARGGAAAVSVLTEPEEFKGERAHLRAAVSRLTPLQCPVMRKDFIVDPYQILEARADGAGGVLLIVTMLSDENLGELIQCARDLGLFALLETFDRSDLARIDALVAHYPDATLLAGVNCRNLKSLAVDFERFGQLAGDLPERVPTVAESGVGGVGDIEAVAAQGYRLALVGSALMRTGEPERAVTELVAAGRAAARGAAT